jgi:flagellar assembly protein FliH
MGVIKSTQAPLSLSPFSLADIEEAAKRIMARARQQAEKLLAQALHEAQRLKEEARVQGAQIGRREGQTAGLEEGKKTGHEQALSEHREKLSQAVKAASAIAAELDARRCEMEVAAVREVIDLAIAIGERVTKRIGTMDPQCVLANVAESLKLVVHAADLRIAVNPAQKATLAQELPRLKMEWPSLGHVELIDDAGVAPGGCRLLTHHGVIDADLDVQLRNIAAVLAPEK